jgi:hypothetical protein
MQQHDRQWTEHRWRGVLVQAELEISDNALRALREIPRSYRNRLTAWAVERVRRSGRVRATQFYPARRQSSMLLH